ncbi:RM50 protein, partial [Alectura lathami]|nr:RM50 protein [Alectura lathami]
RALWGGLSRKEEKEVEADKIIPQEKKDPSLICPPPRSRKYVPPENIQSFLESHVREIFGPSLPGDWQQTSLKENRLKFRLLAQLAAELGHAVPNSQLHLMRSAQDVLTFYSTPVKDVSKLDELCAAELPPNLKITREQ